MSNPTQPVAGQISEVVLLMREPLVIDAGFLRSAYQDVLGLKLDTETEFVTGEFPFFMLQTGGVLLSLTMSDAKYGSARYREAFPHHDLRAARGSLGFWDWRRIRRHGGWIGAALLRQQPSSQSFHTYVCNALCPFALPQAAVGLIAPQLRKAVVLTGHHQKLLQVGNLQEIFGVQHGIN